MPSRVIRGEINESESLAQVSMEADLTFRALLVAVDDYGRLDARPAKLKAALYPMRDSVTPDLVIRWVRELAALEDPPVVLYEVAGRPYLALPNWEQHRAGGRRAAESRYPDPPKDFRESPQGDEEILGDPRRSQEIPGDPSVGRRTRDVGRRTSSEGRGVQGGVPADASQRETEKVKPAGKEKTKTKPKTPRVPFPDPIPDSLQSDITSTALEAGLDPNLLIARGRDWAISTDARYAGERGWLIVFQRAVREGWSWVPRRNGQAIGASRPSSAEIRQAKTIQAGIDAMRPRVREG